MCFVVVVCTPLALYEKMINEQNPKQPHIISYAVLSGLSVCWFV